MPNTCALAVHIALEWSGLPYKVSVLERGQNRDLSYLQVNPLGSVPALRLPDDTILTEASALLTYVDNECPEKFKALPRSNIGSTLLAQKLSFYTTELHAAFAPHFAPSRFHPNVAEHSALKTTAYQHISRLLDLTDDTMIWPFVFGDFPSVADPYLYVITRWIEDTPLNISKFPLLSEFKRMMEMDDDVRSILSTY